MENSYLPYGHFVPTPEMVNQLQTLGISAYQHHPWMPNSFFHSGQQTFPSNPYFQGSQMYSSATSATTTIGFSTMNHDVNTEKMEKHRERNREHAKRTRLRKKAAMDGMKTKLLELQREAIHLQKMMDERNTANILLAFSSTDSSRRASYDDLTTLVPETDDNGSMVSGGDIIEQLRSSVRQEIHGQHSDDHHGIPSSFLSNKRLRRNSTFSSTSEENDSVNLNEMQEEIDALDSDNEDGDHLEDQPSHTYQPFPESTVNWKTGMVINAQGNERKLTDAEMYQFRKERNRIHAKMTRDRKKLFTTRMQKLITTLELQNAKIRHHLSEYSSMLK